MEVKPGYKQTEVGVIPEEWEVAKVGEISRVIRGASPRPKGDRRYYGGPVPRLMVEDVTRDGKTVFPQVDSLTEEGAKLSRPCKKGTLTIVCSGTVGIPSFLGVDACIHDGFLALVSIRKAVSSDYLYYQFDRLRLSFESSATHGGVFTNLTTAGVREFIVPLPPTETEQRAIATALSDVDALLGGLDRLIAKKRDLKQAAMQQLLTGQTRLPVFSGEWEVKRLGEVCGITTGKKDVNEGNPNGQFPFFTCSRSHTYSDSYSFDTEAILIAGNGEVGNLHYFKGKFEAYQRTYILSEFTAHIRYLWQQLNARLADALGLGKIGSSIPYIKKENLVDFEFNSPLDTEEQTAIASVLSEMAGELAVLEQRREKTRALKQAMMQELLTGRTRLL